MTDQTCQNCRHWEPPGNRSPFDHYGNRRFGRCYLGESRSGKPCDKETLAVADDSEECGAQLRTKATFSCNQFQPKEQP
jgi:hypothetical protein